MAAGAGGVTLKGSLCTYLYSFFTKKNIDSRVEIAVKNYKQLPTKRHVGQAGMPVQMVPWDGFEKSVFFQLEQNRND